MQDYFLESLKLQRIDFFLKLVAASECSDEEKGLALQWVSELTDELMAKIRSHKYGNDSNLLIVFYVQIMPDDFVMQLHRF